MSESTHSADYVLLDVDGIVNLVGPGAPIRPGLVLLCDMLTCLGYELRLWSAGGAAHARSEAERAGIHGSVTAYFDKAEYPMSEQAALAILGRRPALQVDDDPTERVADWPFMLLAEAVFNPHDEPAHNAPTVDPVEAGHKDGSESAT